MDVTKQAFTHHIFLCADQTKPNCCNKEAGLESWSYLKKRINELGLSETVNRTKANCLRICGQGPIMLIYPQGIWYHSCTPEVVEKVLQEHIIGGDIVGDFLLAENPLK